VSLGVRVVSWNSRRSKGRDTRLAELAPDVAVLPEWAKVPMVGPATASSFVEFGAMAKVGLGVSAFGDWVVSLADVPPISGGVIGAVDVDGPLPFALVAVWSYLSGKPKVNPVIEALDAWGDWLADRAVIVAGDFNTGGGWTGIRSGPMSHFPIVERLHAMGLQSAYHSDRGLEQGVTEQPTFWSSRGVSYMIDHVFTPTTWPVMTVTVGSEDPWRHRSDHAPVVVDLGVPGRTQA
jgi:hypothetical protein